MIKSVPLKSGDTLTVRKCGDIETIIDYEVPVGFVAVVTIAIDLFQRYPPGLIKPGGEKPNP